MLKLTTTAAIEAAIPTVTCPTLKQLLAERLADTMACELEHLTAVLVMEPGDILVLLSDGIYEYCRPGGEQFGEQRVMDLVAAHRDERMQALCETLLGALHTFAAGAPQEDDVSVVLLKRQGSA